MKKVTGIIILIVLIVCLSMNFCGCASNTNKPDLNTIKQSDASADFTPSLSLKPTPIVTKAPIHITAPSPTEAPTPTPTISPNPTPAITQKPITAPTPTPALSLIEEQKDQVDSEQDPDYITNIAREEIIIPGLENEYKFLFVADSHIIVTDENDSQEILENANPRQSFFVNENGIKSAELFSYWIEYANTYEVDAFLMGGDIIDYPSSANINCLKANLNQLDMPYLYTLGNHDWNYPWEYMTETSKNTLRPLFNQFMNDNTELQTIEYDDLIIMGVDDSTNQVDADSIDEIEDILKIGKPVIIMLHVPIATKALNEEATIVWGNSIVLGDGGISPDINSQRFLDMILAEDSPVVAVLAGHVHFANTDMLNGRIVQYVTDAAYKGSGILVTVKGS